MMNDSTIPYFAVWSDSISLKSVLQVNMEQDLTTTNEVYEISVTMEQDRWIRFYNNYNKVNHKIEKKNKSMKSISFA